MGAASGRPSVSARWMKALFGAALLAVGGAVVGWMLIALFSGDPTQSRTLLHLGLAMTALGSAGGQILMLFGGWLIWRAVENR